MVYNERLRDIKIGITTIVASKWLITRKVGEGAFGMVFECMNRAKPTDRKALKAEMVGIDRSQESLKMEVFVLRKLAASSAKHCVKLFAAGKEKNFNYVVMTLLGMSLSDIRKRVPDEKLSMTSIVIIALQCTEALREIHHVGLVHRDVKPSNFAVGKDAPDWVYIIDFGICREIMYMEDLRTVLRTPRKNCQFRGTTRYCSLNAHKRKELGRHDDLISMMYMLIEMHQGSLPWKHKDRIETEKMKAENEAEMLEGTPKGWVTIYEGLKRCKYNVTPDYKQIRDVFIAQKKELRITFPYTLDWQNFTVAPFERCNSSVAQKREGSRRSMLNENTLLLVSDIPTMLDIPDEFPEVNSCSESERTIPSDRNDNDVMDENIDLSRAPRSPGKDKNKKSDAKSVTAVNSDTKSSSNLKTEPKKNSKPSAETIKEPKSKMAPPTKTKTTSVMGTVAPAPPKTRPSGSQAISKPPRFVEKAADAKAPKKSK